MREEKAKHLETRKSHSKLWLLIVGIVALLVLIIGAISLTKSASKELTGTWVYDSQTEYFFDGAGGGTLISTNAHFDYTYQVSGHKVKLDFADDAVEDAAYRFRVEGDTLTLIGKKGTVGGTYELYRVPEV